MRKAFVAVLFVSAVFFLLRGNPPFAEEAQRAKATRLFDVSAIAGPHTLKIPVLGWGVPDDERFTYIADDLMEMDDIIQYVYNETGPANWTDEDFLAPAGDGKLAARNYPEILDATQAALARLMPRREHYRGMVGIFELKGDSAALADSAFKDFPGARAMLEAAGASPLLVAPVTLRPDRSVLLADLKSLRYISDYTVRVGTLAAASETITEVLHYGTELVMKLKETEKGVKLAVSMERWTLEGMDNFKTPAGDVQQPKMTTYLLEQQMELGVENPAPAAFPWRSGEKSFLLLIEVR